MFGFGMLKAFVVAKGWILPTNFFFFFLLFAFKAFGSVQSMPCIVNACHSNHNSMAAGIYWLYRLPLLGHA